jgi:DUF883 C-terminal glycine zipper region
MLVSPNAGMERRKDLHIGGLGAVSSGTFPSASLVSMIDPLVDASENWVQKAREFVSSADDYVRSNPWQALGAMAILGVTLGYFLSRRS